jgi:hypothetical protein
MIKVAVSNQLDDRTNSRPTALPVNAGMMRIAYREFRFQRILGDLVEPCGVGFCSVWFSHGERAIVLQYNRR